VVSSSSFLLLRGRVDVGAAFAGAERTIDLVAEVDAAGVRALFGASTVEGGFRSDRREPVDSVELRAIGLDLELDTEREARSYLPWEVCECAGSVDRIAELEAEE